MLLIRRLPPTAQLMVPLVGIIFGGVTEAVAEVSPRVALVLKADIRPGWIGQLTAKVERVEERLRVMGAAAGDGDVLRRRELGPR